MSNLDHSKNQNHSLINKKNKDKQNKDNDQDNKDPITKTIEEIEQMKLENKQLKEEIETENRINHVSGQQLETRIEEIQEVSSLYAKQIEIQSKKKRDLETLISLAQDNISDNIKKMNQSNGVALPQLQAKLKQLEYKLEKTRGKHNESLAQINMLKEKVNMARRERVIFSNVFKKLEGDIKQKDEEFKKYMIEKIHVDNKKKVYEEELKKIKQKAQKQTAVFKKEYEEVLNSTQNENNNNKRIFDTEVILQNDQTINKSSVKISSPTMKQNASKNQQKINLQTIQEEVQHYQFLFQKLQKETGIENIDELIHLFQNIENENNQLYEQANNSSDEIVNLKNQIKQVEQKISKYQKKHDNSQNNKENDEYLQEYQLVVKKGELLDEKVEILQDDMNKITQKFTKIAERFNIPIPKGEIDDQSFIHFLKDIEKRVNDIIAMSLYCEGKVADVTHHFQETMASIKTENKKEDHSAIIQILDIVKKKSENEAERILTKGDFQQISKDELKNFKDNRGKSTIIQKKQKVKN